MLSQPQTRLAKVKYFHLTRPSITKKKVLNFRYLKVLDGVLLRVMVAELSLDDVNKVK